MVQRKSSFRRINPDGKYAEKYVQCAEPDESGVSFGCLCDEWLHSVKGRVRSSTYVKYGSILEIHIKPALGVIRPETFNVNLVECFSDILLCQKGLSPKTVRDILSCLRSVIRYINERFPNMMPSVHITSPKAEPGEIRVLSPDEQKLLVDYLTSDLDSCKFGVLLALLTGMRIGEICALRWNDINTKEGIVHIRATMQRLKDVSGNDRRKTELIVGAPKSSKSLRTIPLTEKAACLCMKMQTDRGNVFVLTGTEHCMEPRTLQYRFKRYAADCKLENVHFHTLRHTFATRAVEAGFEIKTLSEILGHSSASITLDRYVHASLELKRRNMNKLDSVGL